jgi:hypothetical protein
LEVLLKKILLYKLKKLLKKILKEDADAVILDLAKISLCKGSR